MFDLGSRLHDWLHRRRLIRGQQWGQPSFAQRLLRIRLGSSLLVALPPLLLCVWYSFTAWAAHLAHQAESGSKEPFTWRLFQLHIHDKLVRDLHRLTAPEPQHKSTLPTYGLVISNDNLDQLARRVPPDDGQSFYVDAQLVKGSRAYNVQARYRGGKYWHYNHPQKSWKVRVKDGKFVEGLDTFNFINTPESVPFEEQIILDVARELGLLAPEYFPFRLLVNKAYTGVYFFESQPDEGMLRYAQRPPGAVYSGRESQTDPLTPVSALFKSADNFIKVTRGFNQRLGERRELDELVAAINESSPAQFARYADSHLDVGRFARWDALDVVFGCDQHGFTENHKLYFDPYRDRFEPIAWNFRGCKHEPVLDRTETPLIARLKQLPQYLSIRNRIVYELIHSSASVSSLRWRTEHLLDRLREDQTRDPYWDAHELLPAVSPYYSSLLRPVDLHAQAIAVDTRLFEMQKRQKYLTETLEAEGCSGDLTRLVPKQASPTSQITAIDITVSGRSGYSLIRVEPKWPATCIPKSWQLSADTNLDGEFESEQDRQLGDSTNALEVGWLGLNIYPGAVMQQDTQDIHRAKVRVEPEPRSYRFYVTSIDCAAENVTVWLRNLVTGSTVQSSMRAHGVAQPVSAAKAPCSDRYTDEPGYESPHPWCYPQIRPESVSLGPGVVDVENTRVYTKNQPVEIKPGTTIRLAKEASLVFMGKVTARGSVAEPIKFEGKEGDGGGIVIHGDDSKGSVLEYVQIGGGTKPTSNSIPWGGLVNLSDTSDVRLEHCRILAREHASALQVSESRNIVVSQTDVQGGRPAITVEYSSAVLEGMTIVGSLGDAVNITASQVDVRTSKVIASDGLGIAANRRSDVRLADTVVARTSRGIRVHEASHLDAERVLLFKNRECIGFDAFSDSYSRKAHIAGTEVFELDCEDPVRKGLGSGNDLARIGTQPTAADLLKLRTDVLGIAEWSQLNSRIEYLSQGVAP